VYQRDINLVINQFDARITALEQALSGTRSLSLSKSAVKEEETKEEVKEEEETKEEER
jgi:ribosomal protein L12E/L44/L45/RPP1/RPP2